MKRRVLILACCVLLAWMAERPAQAAIVTPLDITGGSIDLDFGSLGHVSGSFTQNGLLVMGQYQPPPNVFPPIQISHLMLSIFTSATPGGWYVSTGQTTGSAMTVDLRSLFAGVSSTQWGDWMTGPTWASLSIGGNAPDRSTRRRTRSVSRGPTRSQGFRS